MNERICNQHGGDRLNRGNIKRTSVVVAITLVTMAAEILYGLLSGSMALLADGIHMGTHAFALLVTLAAYFVAGRNARNRNFAFSSGKVGILGGYTNAIILGITAFFMIYEAILRFIHPEEIFFDQALLVAVIGLSVNLVSALLLSAGGHSHGREGGSDHHHHDHNLRSAFIHVVTDAMTSVLAIIALLSGKLFGQTWPDAAVAILGALVILKWAWDLLFSSGKMLVDYHPVAEDDERIRSIAGEFGSVVRDLHVWNTSERDKAIILNLEASEGFDKEDFSRKIRKACGCSHLTLEIDRIVRD